MRILKAKDEALYAKLVRLAGGDSGLVLDILSSKGRPSVDLTTVIAEIQKKRAQKRGVDQVAA